MSPTRDTGQRVAALRDAFDRGFAAPVAPSPPPPHHLLLVRLVGATYAVRATEAIALAQDRKIVPVPSGMRALLGLCGFRGDTLPVFSMAALLDLPGQGARWIAVCGRGVEHVGLAFESLEGYDAVEPSDLHPLEPRPHALLAHSARVNGASRPVIDIPAVLDLIGRQRDELRRSKEPSA